MPQIPSSPITARPIRQLLAPFGAPADGMAAQQRFMEIIAQNISNAEVTRTPEGGPYKRQVAVTVRDARTGALSTQVVSDPTPGRMEHIPGHPDADADGNVWLPNVDVNGELVDLMLARRVHEANVSVFQAAKSMIRRAMDI